MNAREGMRRVGIVLGVLGGITGGVIGYWDVQNVWSAHSKSGTSPMGAPQRLPADFFDQKQAKADAPDTLPLDFLDQPSEKQMVPMIAPDGSLGYVPRERVGDAVQAGGKIVVSPQTLSQQDIYDLIQVREA